MGGSKVNAKDRVHEPAEVRSDQGATTSSHPKIPKKLYAAELLRLQEELVKMAEWKMAEWKMAEWKRLSGRWLSG